MKYNLKNFERLKFPLSEEEQAMLLEELDMMKAELREKLRKLETSKVLKDYNVTRAICELEEILGE